MLKKLLALFRNRPAETETEPEILTLQSEVASLTISVNELKEEMKKQKTYYEKRLADAEANSTNQIAEEMEKFFTRASGPLSQLLMQEGLLSAGKPVNPTDIMKLVKSLEAVFSEDGLRVISGTGSKSPFDPERMTPMGAYGQPDAGEEVTILIPGMEFRGRVIRQAYIRKGEA